MNTFLKKIILFLLFSSVPIAVALIGYLYFDPFKVLYVYNDYSYPSVVPNRDYVSTQMFIKNYKKYHYNSFIFGSSRTIGYRPSSWRKYLSHSDRIFMFDASKESIYGIYTKMKFLDSLNVKMDNVLIVLCRDASFNESGNHTGHLYIKDPVVSGESNFSFQMEFFKAYLSPKFIFNFYAYHFTGVYKPYMAGIIENKHIKYDTVSNQLNIIDQDEEIENNFNNYYTSREDIFYNRAHERIDSINRIKEDHLFMLKEIKRILKKRKTNYKVILNPLYEQIKFSPKDKKILEYFFKPNLFDFSGKNSITDLKTNYYETSHFRPIVGDQILMNIYAGH